MQRRDVVIFGLMFALGLALYWPVFLIRPLDGDNLYILAWVHSARPADLLLGDPAFYPEWRPLAYLAVALEYRLFGLAQVPLYFPINLTAWTACAWLVYRIVWELTGRPLAGAVAGLVPFVDRRAHEALTWIVEQQTLLACMCGLAAFLIVVRARARTLTPAERLAAAVLLVASMLGKEYGAAFVVALAVHGWFNRRRDHAAIAMASLGAYAAMRLVIADGAVGAVCSNMGFFFDIQEQCVAPLAAAGTPQMLYNSFAAAAASVIAGLFNSYGAIDPTPYRIAISLVVLLLALVGLRRARPILMLPALLPLTLGVTSFMVFHPRNVLIGLIGVALLAGVGLARLERVMWMTRLHVAVRTAVILILLLAIGRRAFDAHQFVKGTAASLNRGEPCTASIRSRGFGASFVPLVKRAYALPDPDCTARP